MNNQHDDEIFFGSQSSDFARKVYREIPSQEFERGFELGPFNTREIFNDPKRLGFLFARYKFVSKMLQGCERALEIGCQEGLGSMVIAKVVGFLLATDFYKPHIESCVARLSGAVPNIEFRGHDILDGPVAGKFDAALSIDVIEHIDPNQEYLYMRNIATSLTEHGIFVVGTPSLESQQYASVHSKAGHINCKTGESLRALCKQYYHNVFVFGMNDEMLHTGFLPMAHYLFALCVEPKKGV